MNLIKTDTEKNIHSEVLLESIKTRFFLEQKRLVSSIVREAFENRKIVLVNELAGRLLSLNLHQSSNENVEADWIIIESLSALRSQVGGRFENLKERWVCAGLPVKSHRGEVVGEIEIISAGWSELSRWILKQGYEIRRCSKQSDGILKIRKIS